jgi:hypothetical protein
MRWAGHMARTERNLYKVLMVKPEVKRHLEDKGVDGRLDQNGS